jgi:pyruvate/2-oxoglutarate dehydrogenase complex dihydrolipoamide dehydrogenase (E3) component
MFFPFLSFPCEQPFVLRDTFIRTESGKDEIRLFVSNGETVEADWVLVAKGIVPNMELVTIHL